MARPDATGKGYDLVGRASEVELRVHSSRRLLTAFMRDCEFKEDGFQGYFRERCWAIDLPPDGRRLLEKPTAVPTEEEPPLSPRQKAFLAKGYPLEKGPSRVDKRLQQAFGAHCPELKCAHRMEFGRLVLATDSIEAEPDGRLKVSPCSIARFGGASDPADVTTIRSRFAFIKTRRPVRSLTDLCRQQTLTIECSGGVRLTVETGIRPGE